MEKRSRKSRLTKRTTTTLNYHTQIPGLNDVSKGQKIWYLNNNLCPFEDRKGNFIQFQRQWQHITIWEQDEP